MDRLLPLRLNQASQIPSVALTELTRSLTLTQADLSRARASFQAYTTSCNNHTFTATKLTHEAVIWMEVIEEELEAGEITAERAAEQKAEVQAGHASAARHRAAARKNGELAEMYKTLVEQLAGAIQAIKEMKFQLEVSANGLEAGLRTTSEGVRWSLERIADLEDGR